MDIKIALSLCLIVLLGEKCFGWNLHFGYTHGGNSEYIHSNDTMRLTLEKNTLLKVEPNSVHELRFMLENFGSDGHFSISHMSEDNLRGLLQNTEEYLSRGQSATITISNIRIPDVPIGTKVSISLTAERDTRNKRSAQGSGGYYNNGGQGGSFNGGSQNGNSGGSFGGNDPYYPNGNGGQGGSFNGGGNNGNSGGGGGYQPYYPNGNGGQGGSFNGGSNNGNNGGGSFGGNDPYYPNGNGGQGGSFNDGGRNGNSGGGGSFGGNDPYYPNGNGGQGGSFNGGGNNGNSGGGSFGGNDPYYPNGNGGQGGSFNGGGQGGGFGGQGGSMGGQGQRIPNNGGNGYFPNNGGNNIINWNDPSLRREITLTVEFTIVDSDDADSREKHHPWIEAEFAAQSREDSCHDTSSSFCEDKWWWVQFTTADYKHGSGIRSIDMDKSRSTNGGRRPDADINGEQVYYRYKNFVVGSDDEIEVVAGTSCCNEHMRILVEDVDGNVEEMSVKSTHYGSLKYCDYCLGLSLGAFWGIIVGVVVVLIIVIVLISYFCCCKKSCAGYSAANTN